MKTNRKYSHQVVANGEYLPSIREFFAIQFNFILVSFGWIFFRSNDLPSALTFIERMFLNLAFPNSKLQGIGYVLIFLIIDWFLRKDERLSRISKYRLIRYLFYLFLMFNVVKYFGLVQDKFIYFDF